MYSMLFEEFIESFDMEMPFMLSIFMELFVSLHMTAFVIYPFSCIFFPKHPRIVTTTLLAMRLCILIILDFVIPGSPMSDFFAVFIGAFTIFPIFMIKETITSIKNKGKQKADDKKLTRDEIPKMRLAISIIYGIFGALVLSSKFFVYKYLPTTIALIILTGFYIYLYVFYPKKHAYKEAKEDEPNRAYYIIYIVIMLSSLVFFTKPRIIYSCGEKECKVVKYVEGISIEKKVKIPSKYKGKNVTKVGAYAFYENDNLIEIDIPMTVNEIETKAFKGCSKLEVLIVSEDIVIDDYAVDSSVEIIKK